MLERLTTVLLLLVALVHLLPTLGVLSAERLQVLYGIAVDDANLEVLMRHRAVLFGLLGVFIAVAAFLPALQSAAFAAALVSILSFLLLAAAADGLNEALRRVVVADLLALAALAGAAFAYWLRWRG